MRDDTEVRQIAIYADFDERTSKYIDDKKAHKSWIFTLNNYTEKDFQMFCDFDCTVVVVGKEIAKTGTPHLQGYVCFNTPYRFKAVKELHQKAYWAKAERDDYNYCIKEQSYFIKDNRAQGTRNDWVEIKELAMEGKFKDILENHTNAWVRCEQGIRRIHKCKNINILKRKFEPTVIWIYGPSGVGKTRYIYDRHDDTELISIDIDESGRWLDYENEPIVIFDEFRKNTLKWEELLKITDRYPMNVKILGNGSRTFNSHTIYITSPHSPQDMFECYDGTDNYKQLLRRITKIIHIKSATDTEVIKG